jgi:PAS domain S-box-containing protein
MTTSGQHPPARLAQVALESLREGLIAIDAHGTIHLYNDAAATLIGVPIDRAVKHTFAAALLELPEADALTDVILDAMQAGRLHTDHEVAIESLAGRRLLQVTTSLLRDDDTDVESGGVVITLRDVTELRRLASEERTLGAALAETNQQLQQAYRDVEAHNQRLTEALKRVQVMRIGATVVVLALVGGIGWYSIRLESTSAPASPASGSALSADPAVATRTVTVERGTISRGLRLAGALDPRARVPVVAAVSGRVVSRTFHVGDTVREGQVLIELADDALSSRIRTAEVAALRARTKLDDLRNWEAGPEVQESRRNLTLAEMTVNELRKALEESERLFAKDIIAEQEVTNARAALQRGDLSVQSAQQSYDQTLRRGSQGAQTEADADLRNADDDLARLQRDAKRQQVVAPVSGLVVPPPVTSGSSATTATIPSAGDMVSAGAVMFAIGDVSAFTVVLKVDELEIGRIRQGQAATITIEALPGVMVHGAVDAVAGQAATDNGTPTFEVRVNITQVPDEVRASALLGMTATVEIITALREHVVVLPVEALNGAAGEQFVWVQDAPGKPRVKRMVTIGLADNANVEIMSGLKEGEVVVY